MRSRRCKGEKSCIMPLDWRRESADHAGKAQYNCEPKPEDLLAIFFCLIPARNRILDGVFNALVFYTSYLRRIRGFLMNLAKGGQLCLKI